MIDEVGLRWLTAMREGAFEAAHAISDAVLANRNPSARDDPRLPYHLRWVWDGSDLAGQHILVRCYHGLGDTIQFARFLPILRRQAASVSLEAQPELLGLLGTMWGMDRLLAFRLDCPARPAECDVEIMELAHALRLGPEAAEAPYLAIIPAPLNRPPGLNVGLCWRAGEWDPARSVPLSMLRAACDTPGLHLWSLQHRSVPERLGLRPAMPPEADVLATASTIAALDLVVTVDTMVAHLAGALGKPTWLLLRRECDWRWMERRADSPWYPSMRLYRQATEGDWSAPLAQLALDLRLRVSEAGC